MNHEVLDPIQTLARLVEGSSLARFGDSELRLCLGMSVRLQPASDELQEQLVLLLRREEPGLLVGLPYFPPGDLLGRSEAQIERWTRFRGWLKGLASPDLVYGSSFVSRPDHLRFETFDGFYGLWETLFRGRNIVLVEKANDNYSVWNRTTLNKIAGGLAGRVEVPEEDAFNDHDRILSSCLDFEQGSLFLISAGACATVLSADLSRAGHQAVDVGQLGRLWRRLDGKLATAESEASSERNKGSAKKRGNSRVKSFLRRISG